MIFFAGHGIDDANNFYYFLPVGADTGKLKSTAVPYSEIQNTVKNIAGKVLFFVDTCRSGGIMGGRRGPPDIQRIVNELASAENGAVVFAFLDGEPVFTGRSQVGKRRLHQGAGRRLERRACRGWPRDDQPARLPHQRAGQRTDQRHPDPTDTETEQRSGRGFSDRRGDPVNGSLGRSPRRRVGALRPAGPRRRSRLY